MTNFTIDLPPGIDRAVLRILSERVGQYKAIARPELVGYVQGYGFLKDCSYEEAERIVRHCINQLRKQGVPICSIGGKRGGYYYSDGWDDLMGYIHRELDSRISDLMEQRRALKDQAEKTWGRYSPEKQESFL